MAGASAGRTTLATTGLLKIEPFGANFHADFLGGSDGTTGSEIKWKGTLTEAPSGVFKFTGDAATAFRFLEIENYTRLGGLSLNKAGSTTPLKVETAVTTTGAITINGGDLTVDVDLATSCRWSGSPVGGQACPRGQRREHQPFKRKQPHNLEVGLDRLRRRCLERGEWTDHLGRHGDPQDRALQCRLQLEFPRWVGWSDGKRAELERSLVRGELGGFFVSRATGRMISGIW